MKYYVSGIFVLGKTILIYWATAVHGGFNQSLVDEALKNTTSAYRVAGRNVAKAVQATNILAHKLTRETNPQVAQDIADTLIGLLSHGQGVGGMRHSTNPDCCANPTEQSLMIEALIQAVKFSKRHGLTESGLVEKINDAAQGIDPSNYGHAAHATALMMGAYYGQQGQENPRGYLSQLAIKSSPLTDWLKGDKSWIFAQQALSRPLEVPRYNCEIAGRIENLRRQEDPENQKKIVDDLINHIEKGYLRDFSDLAILLKTTVIRETADYVAKRVIEAIKKIDFQALFSLEQDLQERVINALIAVEKYRMLETEQGDLRTIHPELMEYRNTSQSLESEAILMALVNAIQNYLYNPSNTVEDLVKLLRFERNNRHLRANLRPKTEHILSNHHLYINARLLELIDESTLNINDVQKLTLDRAAAQRPLLMYAIPHLNQEIGQLSISDPVFIHTFPSAGDGACGFYSLGFNNRNESYEQMLDNLKEPEGLLYAARITDEATNMRRAMTLLITPDDSLSADNKRRYKELQNKYREAYIRKNGIDKRSSQFNEAQLWQKIIDDFKKVDDEVRAAELEIDAQFEAEKAKYGIGSVVSDELAPLAAGLKFSFDFRVWKKQTEFIRLFYTLEEFQNIVWQSIQDKFQGGWLEFDPNPDPTIKGFSYPDFIAELNNYGIYAWVSREEFERMQPIHYGRKSIPIYTTEDGKYHLVTLIQPHPTSKPLGLINTSGFHYDQWIEAKDYPRLARAVRHIHVADNKRK